MFHAVVRQFGLPSANSQPLSRGCRHHPITVGVELPRWTFGRGADRLVLTREETAHGVNLIVGGEGVPRVYSFSDLAPLVRFQSDMESFLLRTGWQFIDFAPDRRSGVDRRDFPRIANDRRRWWTDGVKLLLPRERRAGAASASRQTAEPAVDDRLPKPGS